MSAWEQFEGEQDWVELSKLGQEIIGEHASRAADEPLMAAPRPESTDVTPLNGGESVVLTVRVTKAAFEKYTDALEHYDDHDCAWGLSVILDHFDLILESLGEFWLDD